MSLHRWISWSASSSVNVFPCNLLRNSGQLCFSNDFFLPSLSSYMSLSDWSEIPVSAQISPNLVILKLQLLVIGKVHTFLCFEFNVLKELFRPICLVFLYFCNNSFYTVLSWLTWKQDIWIFKFSEETFLISHGFRMLIYLVKLSICQ